MCLRYSSLRLTTSLFGESTTLQKVTVPLPRKTLIVSLRLLAGTHFLSLTTRIRLPGQNRRKGRQIGETQLLLGVTMSASFLCYNRYNGLTDIRFLGLRSGELGRSS